MQPLRNNTNIMATSLTVETTTKARMNSNIPPPPGMTSSSSGSQSDSPIKTQHMLNNNNAFRNPPPGMSSPSAAINAGAGMIRRRAASTDDAGSHRLLLQSTTHAASGTTQQPTTTLNAHSYTDNISPWNNIAGSSSNGGGIFRTSSTGYGGERALSSSLNNRLRSDRLDPMLSDVQLSPNTNNNDDDSSSIHDEQRYLKNNGTSSAHTDGGGGSSASTNDIFRSRGYSPIIGTPTRASGGRKPMWSLTSRASHDLGDLSSNNDTKNIGMGDNDNNKLGGGGGGDNEMDWISSNAFPMIRPSLSCPTSVFESPLFPRSSSSSSSVSGGGVQGLGIQHSHTMSTIMNNGPGLQYIGGGSRKNNSHQQLLDSRGSLLSQPYRLEKIMSASQEVASPENDEGGERMSANFDDDEESVPANLDDDDVDGLGNVDVSVIECDDDEESPFRSTKDPLESVQQQQQQPQNIMSSSQHHHPTSHSMVNRPVSAGSSVTMDVGGYPMRKLSDAFEMLVVNGDQQSHHATNSQQLQQLSGSIPQSRSNDVSKSGVGESSAIKPSPTSVSGFESEPSVTNSCSNTTATTSAAASNNNNASSAVSTHQLENGLTVASISMPHFHLHSSLRGTLCQGLIDRVSFYSVLRDINKEALDAAMTDPKGVVYNDGTVHEKNSKKKGKKKKKSQQQPGKQGQQGGQNSDENSDSVVGGSSEGKQHVVVAKDDKVHLHPNPKEEVNSVLVMACVSEDHNPNEPMSADGAASSMSSSQHGVTTIGKPPSLGAALLDEEWWLMSAIASRTPEEVAMNQSTKLLPTFFEAMGEKDGTGSVAESTGAYSTGASSRTQLWKPGRSWWEAKSGKNPWVEPVVHNNRWRYLWPLIHYHKFIAKCIKKLKRNNIDVKTCESDVCLFLRQEVCNISDHLAFMSKYDSEEWTSALSHFVGWADPDPNVEGTVRTLVASQQLVGVSETADVQSSLLRSQIDDTILKAMQSAKDEAGKDVYEYKDAPEQRHPLAVGVVEGGPLSHKQHPGYSAQDSSNSFGRQSSNGTAAWTDESHLRSALESKKRTINDTSWSNRSEYHPHHPSYPHQYPSYGHGPPPPGYGHHQGYGGSAAINGSQYYSPHHYDEYGQYHTGHHHPPPHHMYPHHGDMQYNDRYGHHHHQYYNGGGGYYQPSDGSSHGSFHEGMVFDHSMHSQDPYMHPSSVAAHTPNRYHGSDMHHGQYPPSSPYWGHLNISQLPGLAASPGMHITPSKPPRGSHPNRSYRKQQRQHPPKAAGQPKFDGKAKSLIMFPNQTNSPASRFVMSPQDKSNPYYAAKNARTAVPADSNVANQSTGPEESFVLPTIEDYSPESPSAPVAIRPSNTSMDMMPPSVKKMYGRQADDTKNLAEVSENPPNP